MLRLSVSSNGSNGLRPRAIARMARCPTTFSILERIEWAATPFRSGCGPGRVTAFSILERIEWAATPRLLGVAHRAGTFSILERIEWAATKSRYS